MADDIARAKELLEHATSVAVLTGAGISAESGIPTFRDALTGLWEKFRPEELATPEAFEANPKLVWDGYARRREIVAKVVLAGNPRHAEGLQTAGLEVCEGRVMGVRIPGGMPEEHRHGDSLPSTHRVKSST